MIYVYLLPLTDQGAFSGQNRDGATELQSRQYLRCGD